MTKPTSYRGIPYTITKGPSLQQWSTRPAWHGVVILRGEEERFERETKWETIEAIEQVINIHLDYEGDHRLYRLVENLVAELIRHDEPWQMHMRGEQSRKLPPTVGEMRKRLHRVCEIAEKILITRYADSDRAALIGKLREMTVERGATPAEAATALLKLQQLEAGR